MLAAASAPLDVYLKVNSGMNRLGFAGVEVAAAYQSLADHPRVNSLTLMTHFADADGATGIAAQLERFASLTKSFRGVRSLANSAALIRFPEARGDWVRPGIMLYGCSPFADRSAEALGLRPAMTLTTEIIATHQRLRRILAQQILPRSAMRQVVHLHRDHGITKDAKIRPRRLSLDRVARFRIGVIACGYADGYPRHAPAGTPALVNGRRTGIVGRVSMDMITLDLSAMPEAGVGAPVTLWGQGLSADEVAAAAGTLSYELLCALAPRVPVVEVP